jgi:hypothetical protein
MNLSHSPSSARADALDVNDCSGGGEPELPNKDRRGLRVGGDRIARGDEFWGDPRKAGDPLSELVAGDAVAIVRDSKSQAAATCSKEGSARYLQYVLSCSSSFNSANVRTGVLRRGGFRKGESLGG